jgi:eukaryotic-like serine/threonine-protein kinase
MLRPGDRLGPYEVLHLLGSGGMGEVYRARDARLNRDVALKVLPDRYRFDNRRVSRLEREARALAAVNHPNIATLYGVEQSDGVQALVMEHVDGDTLADRIAMARRAHGAGLPMAEAADIARQVADALEAAHERGIVHRDLKPANIKVRADGTVKVLDFGLAADGEPDVDADSDQATATTSHPWGPAAGTPAYMSPEQARGGAVDRRADVWAFGCVLYEMVTGRRAFEGATASDVLARVLEREPELDALPRETPASVRRVLRRTLVKDARHRLHDIADARLELVDADPADASVAQGRGARASRRGLVAAAGVVLVLGVAAWLAVRPPPATTPRASRFELQLPASAPLRDGGDDTRLFAISPDGTRIAYLTQNGLAVRSLDRLEPEVLDGRGLGTMPFFSPDGKWVAGTGDGLHKVSVVGGPIIRVADTGAGAIGAWGDDGIVFADVNGLFRVSADGGTPEALPLGTLGPSEQATFPEPLPGGRAILFTVVPTRSNTVGDSASSSTSRIEALDVDTGVRTVVVRGGGRPRYVAGHLVYASNTGVFVVPFDIRRLVTTGEPIQVPGASAEFAVSNDGKLVYAVGLDRPQRNLVWVDRQGREEPLGTPPGEYAYPRLSPDGTRVALDVPGANRDIWVWDIKRRLLERFTSDPTENVLPAWSPDGKHLAFASGLSGVPNIYIQRSDGSGKPERLIESPRLQQPAVFANDGRLVLSEAVPGRGRDILVLDLATRKLQRLVDGEAQEMSVGVSPDGRWLAYMSDESGQWEIYVRPYPDAQAARWKISTNGGRSPLWSRDGRELFYQDFGGAIIAVPVAPGRVFSPGPVVSVLPPSRRYAGFGSAGGARPFDVSLDGSRFLMIKHLGGERPPFLVVVQNWMAEIGDRLRPQ